LQDKTLFRVLEFGEWKSREDKPIGCAAFIIWKLFGVTPLLEFERSLDLFASRRTWEIVGLDTEYDQADGPSLP